MTTATQSDRESLESMVKLEARTLKHQQANDEPYATIQATLWRIHELNTRIANLGMGRTSSFGFNGR